jgi:hypothetical protein
VRPLHPAQLELHTPDHLGAAEMLYYLAQPWMQLLGTLLHLIPFLLLIGRTATDPGWVWNWFTDGAWILFAVDGVRHPAVPDLGADLLVDMRAAGQQDASSVRHCPTHLGCP